MLEADFPASSGAGCATVSIRIVADCGLLSSQVTRKLKRATTHEFTTVSAIIFIHCYAKCIHHQAFLNIS